MNKASDTSTLDIERLLNDEPTTMIRIGVTDMDGVIRGKCLSAERFLQALDGGLSICDCLLGWDIADRLYDTEHSNAQVGWQFGYPDAPLKIVEDGVRALSRPNEDASIFAICEFADAYEPLCPRSLLRRVVATQESSGFRALCGFEYEFTLFREDNDSLRDKPSASLVPLNHGNFGYSILKSTHHTALFAALQENCRRYGLTLDSLHTENGPGIWEAALAPADPLTAADNAVLFKLAVKQFAAEHGLTACFMAKWSPDHQGHGGHMHTSLRNANDRAVFFDDRRPDNVSTTLTHFIGGQQHLMRDTMALIAPTVNSYKRLVPGTWAPTFATWGSDNRTCALRVVGRNAQSRRVEYRTAGADANPYLALGAALGSGLYGIEHALDPTGPTVGNAYALSLPDDLALPHDLLASAQALQASDAARALFGQPFIDHFALSRISEQQEFAKHVTDWELARYAEII